SIILAYASGAPQPYQNTCRSHAMDGVFGTHRDKGSCSNNRANVYNCLYEWYTDNTWRQKTCSPVKELAPGGGSSNRTTARRDCDNTLYTSWRNHVDVDVIGEADTAEWPYNQANVYCRIN
ncbi:hypothetical protein ACFU8W_52400, partial [Streptomyces sp. NPDC057565]|uniref:hypothetical protein n=1 Tax=Streptomyces sp. NPDC057565 TaxID=3346169 RepID=UPI00369D25D0